ncbi:hypothetical protein [Sorangium sp. So ce1335]|uniref:hypothetical protein n=1 Tax=Sorangium sp. So ce1335 TaxID=3133335 RepID=UPI003F5F8530
MPDEKMARALDTLAAAHRALAYVNHDDPDAREASEELLVRLSDNVVENLKGLQGDAAAPKPDASWYPPGTPEPGDPGDLLDPEKIFEAWVAGLDANPGGTRGSNNRDACAQHLMASMKTAGRIHDQLVSVRRELQSATLSPHERRALESRRDDLDARFRQIVATAMGNYQRCINLRLPINPKDIPSGRPSRKPT